MATETKNKVLGVKLSKYLMQRALINEKIEGLLLPKEVDARLLWLLWFLSMKCKKKILIIIKRRNISLIKFANYAGKMPVVGDI